MQHITHRLTSAANMQREICDPIGPRISAVISHTCPTELRRNNELLEASITCVFVHSTEN